MVNTPISPVPLKTNYPQFFRDRILRSCQLTLQQLQWAPMPLPAHICDQALHTLSYSLKVDATWETTRQILFDLGPKLEQTGNYDSWIPVLQQAIQVSTRLNDLEAKAELHLQLGILCQFRANYERALAEFNETRRCGQVLQQPAIEAKALSRLASLARRQGALLQASDYIQKSISLLPNEDPHRAYAYLIWGLIAYDQRAWLKAANLFRIALYLAQNEQNLRLKAWSLSNLGMAWRHLEKYQEVIKAYQEAIALFEEIYDPIRQASAEVNLGNIYLTLKQPDKALKHYFAGRNTFRMAHDLWREANVNQNIAIAYTDLKQYLEAEEIYVINVTQWRELDHVAHLIDALHGLGNVYYQQKKYKLAYTTYKEGLYLLPQLTNKADHDRLLMMFNEGLKEIKTDAGFEI